MFCWKLRPVTPGAVVAMFSNVRPVTGSDSSICSLITAPTAALAVCSSGVEAVTVSCSEMVPIERLSVGRMVSPVRSTTALSSVVLKPASSTLMS